ncbi:TonB-dependent receptor [Roseivirga sp.]|uniref:TonB-dependent receptor n=1 Tax=Roseivirga sp. TaxID=1964215 RepID=UPI003B8E47E9
MTQSTSKTRLLKSVFISLFLLVISHTNAFSQLVVGKVVREGTTRPVSFANIKLVGGEYARRSVGVSANEDGSYTLAVKYFPSEVEVSAVGYLTKRFVLTNDKETWTISLQAESFELEEFVISAEKVTVEELKRPIQIEKLDIADLKSSPSFNFYDAVVNLKGVDVATQSIIVSSVNARGFNSTTNLRFKQFTDGIDTQAPGLGFSLGNIVGPTTLDIEGLELIPGPTTSKYGPGAFNGVLLMTTKNPFDYQGLSFEAKGATIATEQFDTQFFAIGNTFLHDLSVRYADEIVKDKVAFKVNASRLSGSDFAARNYDNIGPGAIFEDTHSTRAQGINGVNVYGDDRSALVVVPREIRIPAPGSEPSFPIASERDTLFEATRQGYREEDLVNYNAENVKLSGAIHFRLNPKTELIAESFYGRASTMITGDDRIALRDFEIMQHKLELKNENYFVRGYTTSQDAGETFNVGKTGESILELAKPGEDWFSQYTRLVAAGRGFANSRRLADSSFPQGEFINRFEPGTAAFDSVRQVIIESQNPEFGAAIFDRSKLYHVETGITVNKWDDFFESFEVGANARMYDPESNGTIFTDSIGNDLTNFEFGFYAEATRKINDKLEATISGRIDKNENFNVVSSQRLSLVKEIGESQFIRGSIQTGLRLPNIREQYFNQNLGDIRLVGGLTEVVDQYDLQGNAFFINSLEKFNEKVLNEANDNVRFGSGPLNITSLRTENFDLLREGIVGQDQFRGIKPERITSLEFGYRGLIENKRLFEVVYYINHYNNFIGTTRVVKPRTSPSTDLQLALEQALSPGSSENIFVSDNARKNVITQGLELVYDVTSDQGTNFAINMTFANIISDNDDPLTPGFNTPPFKLNMTLGNDKIGENFGAEISWRFRSEFEWESSFVDGTVPDFNTFDFQVTYRVPKIQSAFRIGGNNVLNREQFNSFGGPEITSYYYVSFSYGLQ